MGESSSQSRYSIVERLTDKKLTILTLITQLDMRISDREQKLAISKKNAADYEIEAKAEVEKTKRDKQRYVEMCEHELKCEKDNKEKTKKSYENQLIEIDKALIAIQKISETAPTPQEQSGKMRPL
jgi:hypothetical protein